MTKLGIATATLIIGLCALLSPRIFIGKPMYRLAACVVHVVCVVGYLLAEYYRRP